MCVCVDPIVSQRDCHRGIIRRILFVPVDAMRLLSAVVLASLARMRVLCWCCDGLDLCECKRRCENGMTLLDVCVCVVSHAHVR